MMTNFRISEISGENAMTLFVPFLLCILLAGCADRHETNRSENRTGNDINIDVEHVLLAELGNERKKNAAYRLTADGEERIVSWGYRILEWPVESGARTNEVVPEVEGLWYSNGGTVMDVNGNGNEELIVARDVVAGYAREDDFEYEGDLEHVELLWYESVPGSTTWEGHHIAIIEENSPHDIHSFVTQTSDGEARGVVISTGRQKLIWFEIPDDPASAWKRHDLITLPEYGHSGLTIGDISGDGLPDILTGMFWIESPSDPINGTWRAHRFGTWDYNDYEVNWGGMAKHLLSDFDGDGKKDLIVTEAEIENGRMSFFKQNPDDTYGLWNEEIIDTTLYAPHSLVSTDFNDNGYHDVIVGEMTAGGWGFPLQDNPKIYVFWNNGDGTFFKDTLIEGWGVHEMGLVTRPDGTKLLYAADEIQPHKFEEMETHVSYWLLKP
ncbi:MAG: VCBS repeat-containing protein [Balneolales bacterium]